MGSIQRANLDGSYIETLINELDFPEGIDLDVARGKMYWVNNGGNGYLGDFQSAATWMDPISKPSSPN